MNSVILASIILALMWWARNLYHRRLITKHRYKLYAVRDGLRRVVIEGQAKKDSWIFNYLDSSISKSIQYLDCLNLYTLISLAYKLRNSDEFKEFDIQIKENLANENYFQEYYDEYNSIMTSFIRSKHHLTFFILRLGFESILMSYEVVQGIRYFIKNLAAAMNLLPEPKPVPAALRFLF